MVHTILVFFAGKLFFIIASDLRKFQNLNHPKNHEYDGEINETWDNYFSGTA